MVWECCYLIESKYEIGKATASQGVLTTKRKSPLVRLLHSWQLYVLLLPALLYLAIFHYGPMYGLQIAFRDYIPNLGITGSPWVGMKHFRTFFNSPQCYITIKNTLAISLFYLVVSFPMPIILALLLNDCPVVWYKKTVQNLTYIPHFISVVVLVGMVINFTSPTSGVINKLIELLGGEKINFMSNPGWFRPLYVLSGVWQSTGWGSIIYLAALASIDPELYESAKIDGASRLRCVWHISIPGILPTANILLILNCGRIMNVGFEKVFLMQNALNLSTSEVISTYVYKVGLLGAQYSYTSAIGLFNSLVNCLLLLMANGISRRIGETSLF